MNETWPFWAGVRDMELANKQPEQSGFTPEEEMQRNGRDLALRARARDMVFAIKETKLKPNEVGSIWEGGAVE